MPHLLCFGLGYSARALAQRVESKRWTITGTSRGAKDGLLSFDGSVPLPAAAFEGVTHILVSVPPGENGDPVLACHEDDLARRAGQFAWIGYLSTTGVYGDRGGGWVDETAALVPSTERGRRRLDAENRWLRLFVQHGLPVHVFRLAGIYGPGRNQLDALRDGTARAIIKPGQVFSRIHVDDIAGVLAASMARPAPGQAYNVCDDEPSPPQDVLHYGARLLGLPPPPEVPFASAELSAMTMSFYAESKRVANRRIKDELGYRLLYPTYREGFRALLHPTLRRGRTS